MYSIDISFVIGNLDITPGKTVVESGTGSGSLTFSISRALAGQGNLFSFEYNTERAAEAQREFRELKVDNVHIFNRDAYKDGFLVEGKLAAHGADAVFLDLPSPWCAVPHCVEVLRPGGRLCNFSPCIEQVQRMITTLSKEGFGDFESYEVLERTFERRKLKEISLKDMKEQKDEHNQHQADGLGARAAREPERFVYAQANEEGRWHTGYLTFCTKFVKIAAE